MRPKLVGLVVIRERGRVSIVPKHWIASRLTAYNIVNLSILEQPNTLRVLVDFVANFLSLDGPVS